MWTKPPLCAEPTIRRLEPLWAVFVPYSGRTHMLDDAALAVMECLSHDPMTPEAIARLVATDDAMDTDPTLSAHIEAILQRLQVLGLACLQSQ